MSIYFSNCPSKSDHILAPINMPSLQHKSIYYSLTLSSAPLFCSAVWLYHMLALTFLWLPVVYQRQRVHGYPHSFSTCTICPVPQYSSCQVALRLLVKSPSSNLQGLNMTVDFWKRINPKHLQSGVIFLFKTVKKTNPKQFYILHWNWLSSNLSFHDGGHFSLTVTVTGYGSLDLDYTLEGKWLHKLPQKSLHLQYKELVIVHWGVLWSKIPIFHLSFVLHEAIHVMLNNNGTQKYCF